MTAQDGTYRLRLQNSLQELDRIKPWLEQARGEQNLPGDLCFELALCIYEAIANIVMYAYQEPDGYSVPPEKIIRFIDVALVIRADEIEIHIQDDGYHFDPLATSEKKLANTVAEASLSGRGIPLIRGLSDKLTYWRAGGCNNLSILRRIGPRSGVAA